MIEGISAITLAPTWFDPETPGIIAPESQFAKDSPLEGDGFEPSVPHKKQPFLAAPVRSRNSPSATKTGSFVPGTDGSNPAPSSGESGANLDPQGSPPRIVKNTGDGMLVEFASVATRFAAPSAACRVSVMAAPRARTPPDLAIEERDALPDRILLPVIAGKWLTSDKQVP